MSGIDTHTTNPRENGANDNGGEYDERECPMCGATCKKLPAHLRNNCEVTQ